MASVGVAAFERHLDDLGGRIASHATRPETRERIPKVIAALAADLPTKNAWTIAEHAGEGDPHGVQHLLNRASFDQDAARRELAGFIGDYLADPDAVLIGDETGDLKKGTATVGVQRQYSGTAGRTENCQLAVYLAYATGRGHALIDREVYLPASWTDDPARCERAGVPGDVGFATKPTLLGDMVERALAGGLPASWVTADEAYGGDPKLARRLEALSEARVADGEQGLGYVLAISTTRKLPITATTSRPASRVAADLPKRSWQRRSAGAGAHGQREYEWAQVDLHPRIVERPNSAPRVGGKQGRPTHSASWAAMLERTQARARQRGHRWWLLVRRNLKTGEMAYYLAFAGRPVSLAALVAVAGRRWAIEESFQASKGLTGLDEHQVRRWTSWRRWTLLVMAAHAVLAIATLTARERDREVARREELIPLTCAEIRRLVAAAARRAVEVTFVEAWSYWRRRHQGRARTSHYAARGQVPPAK
ncbi:IS701 family transposase [Streptomyces sp. NP160]|uniref:IS701 family transposase n=1 Tax=Streptomyces sp. NP160 TaxID=2586637 RepID=UPI00111B91E0|nr:IS701 family transposase [Streptomyces sp. NP160]TNM56635.1 IS701 family transposase [Streptomyces sp. NP160]